MSIEMRNTNELIILSRIWGKEGNENLFIDIVL